MARRIATSPARHLEWWTVTLTSGRQITIAWTNSRSRAYRR